MGQTPTVLRRAPDVRKSKDGKKQLQKSSAVDSTSLFDKDPMARAA
jgi:hypothetical protein